MDGDGTVHPSARPDHSSRGRRTAAGSPSWVRRRVRWGAATSATGGTTPMTSAWQVPDLYVVNVDGTGLSWIATGGTSIGSHRCRGRRSRRSPPSAADPRATSTVWHRWMPTGDRRATCGSSATGRARLERPPVIHIALEASYTVTLTVTDGTGATGTRSVRVDANAPPVGSFTVVCNGPTCSFDGSASSDSDGTIASYAGYSAMVRAAGRRRTSEGHSYLRDRYILREADCQRQRRLQATRTAEP